MEECRITNWLKDFDRYLDPPGCESSFVSLPGRDEASCTIGIVHEHRFAFYFWGLYSNDRNSRNSILISVDAHDDTGVPSEVIPDDLNDLNIHNRTELGLFAWLRLRSLNDGHILPALYLNFSQTFMYCLTMVRILLHSEQIVLNSNKEILKVDYTQ